MTYSWAWSARQTGGWGLVSGEPCRKTRQVGSSEFQFERARLLGGRVLDALGASGQAAVAIAGDKVVVPLAERHDAFDAVWEFFVFWDDDAFVALHPYGYAPGYRYTRFRLLPGDAP